MRDQNKSKDLSGGAAESHLLTFGHGTLDQDAFVELARSAGIERIIDVRKMPQSRRYPQFGREAMQAWLPQSDIAYRWDARLGGFRKPRPDSRNVSLRNLSFRGYADYMQTPPFWHALSELTLEANAARSAIMCSESLWWRCHRRLIADALVLCLGFEVLDLMHDGGLVPHRVTEGARLDGNLVVYDALTLPAGPGHP